MILIDDVDEKINNLKKTDKKRYLELLEEFQKENPKSRINKPVTQKEIDYLIENLHEELDKNKELGESFLLNKKLIELSEQTIPEYLWKNVINQYNNYEKVQSDFMKVLQFLNRNKLMKLQERVEDFFLDN